MCVGTYFPSGFKVGLYNALKVVPNLEKQNLTALPENSFSSGGALKHEMLKIED